MSSLDNLSNMAPAIDFTGNIQPDNTVALRKPCKAFRVYGTAGDVEVILTVTGVARIWHNVQVGERIDCLFTHIKAANTTAIGIDVYHIGDAI